MIKEALQYITSLKEDAMGIITENIEGETYIKGQNIRRLENDHCKCMAVNTLGSLVDIVRESIMNGMFNEPLMIRISGNTVDVQYFP